MKKLFFFLTFCSLVVYGSDKYDLTIKRDIWGVPHIYGETNKDVAFGLAYAQAEDNLENMLFHVYLGRGKLAKKYGRDLAISDFIVKAFNLHEKSVEALSSLKPETLAVLAGFTDGINYWAEQHNYKNELLPIKPEDIVAGFAMQSVFMYGLDESIEEFYISDLPQAESRGSNAYAVNSIKTIDESTMIMINSHQPLEGPVTWYEARLKSNEGWDIMGGIFPGSPFIFIGFTPNLAWGATVNKPDLVDFFELEVNEDETKYWLDGKWKNFVKKQVTIETKILNLFSFPVKREAIFSDHGLVLEKDGNFFAVRFVGFDNLLQTEQWFEMNLATNLEEWLNSFNKQAIPSINFVYADNADNIGYVHNNVSPERKEGLDWKGIIDGRISDLIWDSYFTTAYSPKIINPSKGYVFSANQNPFFAAARDDNLLLSSFPEEIGFQENLTNRSVVLGNLLASSALISEEEFIKFKFNDEYSKDFKLYSFIEIINNSSNKSENFIEAKSALLDWDLRTNLENNRAPLGVCYLSSSWEENKTFDSAQAEKILLKCADDFLNKEIVWADRNKLVRGNKELGISGGPDILRAIYGIPHKKNKLKAIAGDGLIIYVKWDKDGNQTTKSIHQYGNSENKDSSHYDDQMELFVAEKFKDTFFLPGELATNLKSELKINVVR